MKLLAKLVAGLLAPINGASLIIQHPALRRLALIPFLLTIVVFIFGLAFGLPVITMFVTPFTKTLMGWIGLRPTSSQGEWFLTLLPCLIWPALALALIYLLLTLTRLVAAPFYGLLAERALMKQGVLREEKLNTVPWLKRQARTSRTALVKTGLFLVLGVILGALSFIPGVGLFTSFAFLILLAYDVVDYSLEAMSMGVQQRVEFFRHHFAVFLGLGVALGLVFLIPGLNFFVLPASVAGGADLVRRLKPTDRVETARMFL
jgi:CysZ protein